MGRTRQAQSRAKRKEAREKLLRSPAYRKKVAKYIADEHIVEKMRRALEVPQDFAQIVEKMRRALGVPQDFGLIYGLPPLTEDAFREFLEEALNKPSRIISMGTTGPEAHIKAHGLEAYIKAHKW